MASTAVTAASEDAEGVGPLPVTALEAHGVNGGDIKKLREAGYNTIESIVYAPKKNLLAIKGISEAKADKIMAEGQKLVPTGFTTATAMHLKRSQLIQVSRTKENLISIDLPFTLSSHQELGLVYKLGPVSAALLLPTGMRHLAVAYDIETLTAGMSYSNNQHYDYKILIILRNLPDGPHQVYE